MPRPIHQAWLHRFAALTALMTLALIALGGLVTSRGVGMSVPDWPTTYGYNMFLFPVSKWVGGIFYEHTHRLVATVVGTLVVLLTRWLGGRKSCLPLIIIGLLELISGFALLKFFPKFSGAAYFLSGIGGVVLLAGAIWARNEPANSGLVKLGWLTFVLVQLQGLLGGLRVVLFNDSIGIFHAALAQIFFVVLCVIVLLTSNWWQNLNPARIADHKGLRVFLAAMTLLVFGQLILGATMRHQHAGLSIPDFPLAYHKWWPPMDADSITRYNQERLQVLETKPVTAFQIGLQMAHRIGALLIFLGVVFAAWRSVKQFGARHPLAKISLVWLGLIVVQIILGAATIWSNKAADIATAHVVTGALTLTTGALLTIISFRVLMPVRAAIPVAGKSASASLLPGNPAGSNAK